MMRKPKIRFKGYNEDWEQRKLGKVLKERTERAEGNEELLSVTISNGVIRQVDSDKRNIASEDKSNYKIVCKGDIAYNSMRMWQGAVGNSEYDGIVSPAYTVLVPTEEANSKFFMELFKKESSLQIFQRWSQGLTSDTWNLKYPVLSSIQFCMPSVEEQVKIGEYFSNLDHLITLHQHKCDEMKKLKMNDWEQRKLGETCSRVQGNDGRMELPTLTISAANGWMKQEDRFSGNIAGKEQKNYTLLHKGELSYNHGNSKLAKYGTVFSLQTYEEALVPRVYHSFKVESGSADFIEYYFATKMPDRELRKLISSGARMDGLLNIGYDDFMGIKMMFPSTLEQDKIAEYFRALDHLITLHQHKCDELQNLKKYMLQNMFV